MSNDQLNNRPAAYCRSASSEEMMAMRERQWKTGGPVEVERDLALMRSKGVPAYVIGHAERILGDMKSDFRIKYGYDYEN